MRKLFVLLFIVLAVLVVWNRQRIFFRDPFADVLRDNKPEEDAQVYVTLTGNILVENDRAPAYTQVVGNAEAGLPRKLQCVHYVVCFLGPDPGALDAWPGGLSVRSINSKFVEFRDGKRDTVVALY